MLASAPRPPAGAGISVRVNGVPLGADSQPEGPAPRLGAKTGSSDAEETRDLEWGTATITWRGSKPAPGPQVHVIRVKTPGSSPPGGPAKVHITTSPGGSFVSKDYGGGKISVLVGPKAEDERSSSGASSAPGSDCERSDSDREDSHDSGFGGAAKLRVAVARCNDLGARPSVLECNGLGKGKCAANNDCTVNNCNATNTCNATNNCSNVRLTIASYADKGEPAGQAAASGADPRDMQFHLRELDSPADADLKPDAEDIQTKIAAAHALLAGRDVGGLKLHNKVRSSITSLLVQSASNRNYDQEEIGRIVFYTTSMGIVRTTSERCRKVRKILETLMVKFEERDVFMNRGFQQEVRERLGTNRVIVPQVFLEGRHLGTAEVIEQLNEIGHLRELLRPYKRQSIGGVCQQCGGYRYLLCPICGGSKKSVTHRHHFSEDLVALRCVSCDESGLIRCPQCINGEG